MEKERNSCRLPTTVVPVKYSLRYDDLSLDNCKFSGSVIIDCQVTHEMLVGDAARS
ncbi:unnamed protein product [Hapterophycus canaliculatus]